MKRKPWTRVTRDVLLDAPLPVATDTYTVISHSFCINTIKKLLSVKGFKVVNEIYSATDGAQIATGMFHINHGDDPELGMLFAFANSYNKKVKFSCSVGAYVKVNETSILTEGGSAWIRKHTGNADELAEEVIKQQVEDVVVYFDQLLKDKEAMKLIRLNQTQYAELLGRLYLDVQILAIGQVSHVRAEYHKPSYTYSADTNSLWTLYNHILLALAKSHPKTWMDQQKLVHLHISTVFDLTQFDEVVDDTQMEDENGIIKVVDDNTASEITDITEEVNAGPEAPAEEDEETEILTDEDIAEHKELEEVIEEPFTEEKFAEVNKEVDEGAVGSVIMEEVPVEEFITDEQEDAVMEQMFTEVPVEEPEFPEEHKAETKSMSVEDALEKYGHMLTEEELEGFKKGLVTQRMLEKLRELDAQYDVVNEQVDKVITEELAKTGTDTKSYLPQDPSKVKAEMEEVLETAEVEEEVVENEIGEDDFFMTKEDLNGMYEGDLEVGMIITIGDEECEVTHIGNEEVGLCALSDIEEAEPDSELEEEVHVVEEEPIGEDFPEAPAQQIGMDFEIGNAEEAVPSENMLKTKSMSIESVTDVNDEEQAQIDAALEKMAAKVELTPAEQAIHDAIQSEIYELYGEKYDFTYKLNGSQYNITLETDEVFVLEKSYVESLNQSV